MLERQMLTVRPKTAYCQEATCVPKTSVPGVMDLAPTRDSHYERRSRMPKMSFRHGLTQTALSENGNELSGQVYEALGQSQDFIGERPGCGNRS